MGHQTPTPPVVGCVTTVLVCPAVATAPVVLGCGGLVEVVVEVETPMLRTFDTLDK